MFESLKLAVRELSRKNHFWVLIGLGTLGLILDIHSTAMAVNASEWGIGVEANPLFLFLWWKLDSLGLLLSFDLSQVVLRLIIIKIILILVLSAVVIFLVSLIIFIANHLHHFSIGELKSIWKCFLYIVAVMWFGHLLVAFWNYSAI